MMQIADFPRPPDDNGRGIHWSARVYHPSNEPTHVAAKTAGDPQYAMSARIYRSPFAGQEGDPAALAVRWSAAPHDVTAGELDFWISELQATHIKWVKLLDDGGGSSLEICQRMLQAGIMPIVRLFKECPNPRGLGGREFETVSRLVAVGVRYFETNNEPDLPAEWEGKTMPSNWLDIVVDNFIREADEILQRGGLPALPAMGPGSTDNPIARVIARGRRDLFERGAWVAIHNYTLNHPLDYPDDAVNQLGEPLTQVEYDRYGAWSWDFRLRESPNPDDQTINRLRRERKRPGITIFDDPNCFRGYEAAGKMIYDALGFYVPVISTEGGPVVGWGDDKRYNKIIPTQQMEMQIGIVRQMQSNLTPDWYFALCTWLIASRPLGDYTPAWETMSWYTHWWDEQFGLTGRLPIIEALKALPPTARIWPANTPRTALLQGRLLLNDGSAPGPVRLRLQAAGHAPLWLDAQPGGAFDVSDLPAAVYTLTLRDGPDLASFTLADGQRYAPTITLPAGGTFSAITGQALRNGRPQVGEIIELRTAGSAPQTLAQQITLGQGRYHFGPLAPGLYQIACGSTISPVFTLDGWSSASHDLRLPAPPEFRYRVLATQPAVGSPRRIMGRVLDAQGAGLDGINLRMSWPNPDPDTRFPETLTGRDPFKPAGFFEFLASAGQFQIQVIQGDWESDATPWLSTISVPGQSGDSFFWDVTFQLQPVQRNQSIVRGQIVNPPPNSAILLTGSALPDGALRRNLPAGGEFELRDLPPGDGYELQIERLARLGGPFSLDGANTVERRMSLTAALSGRVIGLPAGALVGLARTSPLSWRRAVPLDAEGRYSFSGLPPGRYQMSAGDGPQRQVRPDIMLNEGQTFELPPLDLRPPAHSLLSGLVQHTSGAPAEGIAAELHRDDRLQAQTLSDAAGEFEFGDLTAGLYSVYLPDYAASTSVTLDGLTSANVSLTIPDPEPEPEGPLVRQFLLLGRDAAHQASLVQNQLRLLSPYLALHPDVMVGFDPAQAAKAERVVILGDTALVSPSVEYDLRLAGCQVERVPSDLYALADWLRLNS